MVGEATLSLFRRRKVVDPDKARAREEISRTDQRIQRLRDEAAVITITLPKQKRA